MKDDVEETQKSIDDLQWRSDLVSKKIQETVDATKVVMKIQKQTDDSIDDILYVITSEEIILLPCLVSLNRMWHKETHSMHYNNNVLCL